MLSISIALVCRWTAFFISLVGLSLAVVPVLCLGPAADHLVADVGGLIPDLVLAQGLVAIADPIPVPFLVPGVGPFPLVGGVEVSGHAVAHHCPIGKDTRETG